MQPFADTEEYRTEISISKKTMLLLFPVFAVLTFACPVGVVMHIMSMNVPVTAVMVVFCVCSLVVSLYLGYIAVICFFQLLNNRPVYVISRTGLTINSRGAAIGIGEIPWSDVTKITVYEDQKFWMSFKWICLIVQNPDHYIDKQNHKKWRCVMIRSFDVCRTPIAISGTGLAVSFDELLKIVNEYYAMSQY